MRRILLPAIPPIPINYTEYCTVLEFMFDILNIMIILSKLGRVLRLYIYTKSEI